MIEWGINGYCNYIRSYRMILVSGINLSAGGFKNDVKGTRN
jgi:hypothetical protein